MTQPNRRPIAGLKPKDLVGMPWRVAFALQADGWWLRSDCIWKKPNPMPESVRDRPVKAHEYVFLLTKSEKYFYDAEAVKEPAIRTDQAAWIDRGSDKQRGHSRRHAGFNGRSAARIAAEGPPQSHNQRSVWTIASAPFAGAHFATFPPALVQRCVSAGTSERGCCPTCGAPWRRQIDVRYNNPGNRTTNGRRSLAHRAVTAGFGCRLERTATTTGWQAACGCSPAAPTPCTVLDPFSGAGTTVMVADRLGRYAIGIELHPDYIIMAEQRLARDRILRGDADPR